MNRDKTVNGVLYVHLKSMLSLRELTKVAESQYTLPTLSSYLQHKMKNLYTYS